MARVPPGEIDGPGADPGTRNRRSTERSFRTPLTTQFRILTIVHNGGLAAHARLPRRGRPGTGREGPGRRPRTARKPAGRGWGAMRRWLAGTGFIARSSPTSGRARTGRLNHLCRTGCRRASLYRGAWQQRRDLERQRPTGRRGRVSGAVASNGRQLAYSRLRSASRVKGRPHRKPRPSWLSALPHHHLAVFKTRANRSLKCADSEVRWRLGTY